MPRRVVIRTCGAISLVTSVLLVAAACSVGPSNRPPVAHDGDAPPTTGQTTSAPPTVPQLDQPNRPTLAFTDCTETTRRKLGSPAGFDLKVQCGRLSPPLDVPGRPNRGSAKVAVVKVGTGTVPLVLVNDITGEPGTLHTARLAASLPPELLKTFFLVGVDRRGTGDSDPVRCIDQDARSRIVGFDPTVTEASKLSELLGATQDASQECALDDEPVTAYDSWRTAGDLNALRDGLGVPRLNALGVGEGSRVLTTFADRFPAAVGRFVLDGAPDPTVDAVGQAQNRAAGATQTWEAFTTACTTRGNCPLGADPKQALRALIDQAKAKPIQGGTMSLAAGTTLRAVAAGLAEPSRWTELAEAIGKARGGEGLGLEQFLVPRLSGPEREWVRFDGVLVTACNDTTARPDLARVAELAAEWGGKYPLFGSAFAQELLWCGPWPAPSQTLPPPRGLGAPPMLVLGTAKDPVTPAQGSARTAETLVSAVQVTWQGAGHGAFPRSPCVNDAVKAYLVDGKLAASTTVCPP